MSKFAIVVARDSKIYEPEMLKDKPIAVTPNNGSDFTTLKMMEGFLEPEHVKRTNAGSMLKRLEAVRDGKVAAASLMEPWISVAQKWGMRILIESHSTRGEAAGDDLDGATLKKMFRAQARAVELLEKDPRRIIHYLARETGGLLKPEGAPDLAAAARRAAALHARALRRHLQLDGEVEHDRAGRDLREHGRQPSLAVTHSNEGGSMKKVRASMMNAIHDLPLLVARDEGFFRDQGLDVEIVKTPGSGQTRLRPPGAALQHLPAHHGGALRAGRVRPVPHVRVGHHEARGRVDTSRRVTARQRSSRWARRCRPSRSSPIRSRASTSPSS